MGNYADLEYEFIERTLALIMQYESILPRFPFKEQYNHTLLINCLLGLIVMPKERIMTYIPKKELTHEFRMEIGLQQSSINTSITNLKDLIIKLRHSLAHFDIEVESKDEKLLIDEIVFKDNGGEIVRFAASELAPFVRYYSTWLLSNLKQYRKDKEPEASRYQKRGRVT